METPYLFLAQLVEQLQSQEIDFPQFLHGLDASDAYLQHWSEALQALQPPEGLETEARLKQCALEGIQLLWECSGELRLSETHSDPERVDAALDKAQEGHELIQEVFRTTQETFDNLK